MTREAFIRKWLNTGYGYCEANRDLMRDDLDKVIEYAKPVDPINNDLHIPDVSVSVCKSPKDYICNINDNGICGLPTSCVYKHTER